MKQLTLLLIFVNAVAFSQIPQGGQPNGWNNTRSIPTNWVKLPNFNQELLEQEDAVNDANKSIPYRFAYPHYVNYTISNSGEWTTVPGGKIWRLRVKSAGAKSLNVTFGTYELVKGARLYVYNSDRNYFIGAFTSKNNKENKELGTTPIPGDDIIIELFEPEGGTSKLEIKAIAHDYRGVFNTLNKTFNSSGPCNINTICPQGDNWREQIRSVGLITMTDGTTLCTGSLLNNTSNDETPYFLTANHCLSQTSNTWVFVFSYESFDCSPSVDGNLANSISGATLRASNADSDFGLLEMSAIPPAYYNVFYNGWDKTDTIPTSTVGIHHPSGDVKKISIDNDSAKRTFYSGAECWNVVDWDEGTTEGGSSGSPLFDQNKRVIGQLYGGGAACGNDNPDFYGRFSASWDGVSASTRLKDWLDPTNTGDSIIDGYIPPPPIPNDIAILTIEGVGISTCEDSIYSKFRVFNFGNDTLTSFTYQSFFNNSIQQTGGWTGSLPFGQTTEITLNAYPLDPGSNKIKVIVSNPNNVADTNFNNNEIEDSSFRIINPENVKLKITLDQFGEETSWDVKDNNGLVLASGGPYPGNNNGTVINEDVCLPLGCFDFNMYDSYSDGMCCFSGNGSYHMFSDLGDTLLWGDPDFFDVQTTSFCSYLTSIEENKQSRSLVIYPTITIGQLNIISEGSELESVDIIDYSGKVVKRHVNTLTRINVFNLAKGVYVIRAFDDKNVPYIGRFVKK